MNDTLCFGRGIAPALGMQRVDALRLVPVWVNPDHLVQSAKILLQGHRLRVLGVLRGAELVGVVTKDVLARHNDQDRVENCLEKPQAIFPAETPAREVAAAFVEQDLEHAAVMNGERFVGIVTATMLLMELGRSFDPLTGLSWSDRLREWGVSVLESGAEITILFIDIDGFGSFNKRYGHVVGDRVLRTIADRLKLVVDPTRDMLVRYGGDEFAIATRRTYDEAVAMAEGLRSQTNQVRSEGVDEPVRYSVGLYGGRRTRERENTHFAATLDSLINLASRDCIARKARPPEEDETASALPREETSPPFVDPAAPPEVQVVAIHSDASPYSITEVRLSRGDREAAGAHARNAGALVQSVAIATARALEKLSPGRGVRLDEVTLEETSDPPRLRLRGAVVAGGRSAPVQIEVPVGEDALRTASEAVLQAFSTV